jgi:acetoin utilization deacetylase AcuC-like enzyme
MGQTIAPRDATDEDIERVHAPAYLELVKREIGALAHPRYLSTGDVVVDARSLDVARRAAGGAIAAVEASARSGEPVFALVRPPGHHAESARGMGFCLFNNVAIAARWYQAKYGGRVLAIDFDYHHGNGTEAVAGDGLSYFSTHAYPAYPGTGRDSYLKGSDIVANVPLPPSGIPTEAFVATWETVLPEIVRAVRPSMLVVSAGFDYVAGDPVGDLGVDVGAAAALTAVINAVALEQCGGRVAYVLEGGYDLDALTRSVALVADTSDSGTIAPSGAEASSVPSQVGRTLAQISGIIQGSGPGGAN